MTSERGKKKPLHRYERQWLFCLFSSPLQDSPEPLHAAAALNELLLIRMMERDETDKGERCDEKEHRTDQWKRLV